MTALEIKTLRNLCAAAHELSDFHRGRLIGYGEGLADMQESDRRKAEAAKNQQAANQ